jgi:hypothetical protein
MAKDGGLKCGEINSSLSHTKSMASLGYYTNILGNIFKLRENLVMSIILSHFRNIMMADVNCIRYSKKL